MKPASSWAPANISLFFGIHRGKTHQTTGSIGAGFTVEEGVTAHVTRASKTSVFFNNKRIVFPTVLSVTKALTSQPVCVKLSSSLPLGTGFGLSGASALATAYSLNKMFRLKIPKRELAILAHVAEVENGTGLGDVINQYYGGILIKTKPSCSFVAKRMKTRKKTVYWKHFGTLQTKVIIQDTKKEKKINHAARKTLKKAQNSSFEQLMHLGKEFSKESGLLTEKNVKKTIAEIEKNNGFATMILLGNSVVSTIPFKGGRKLIISTKKAR